jgi:hypothetical protein
MNLEPIIEFLRNFETSRVVEYLKEADLQKLMHSPYFLGTAAFLALLALFMRWRLLLVTVMSITGFVYLLTYTFEQGTSLEGGIGNDTLMVFIGGGAVIVFLAIYLLFIRDE